VKKFGINLFVAIAAFILGLASASALNQIDSDGASKDLISIKTDSLGNVYANQD